jgi:ribA/ribD-fused uncharacterized protein
MGCVSMFDTYVPVVLTNGKSPFGELLNMTGGLPIKWNDKVWKSSEALYQAARFPDHPSIQEDIRQASNGFTCKLVAKSSASKTRPDWMNIRVYVMDVVLRLKWQQHALVRDALKRTEDRDIIEYSKRDQFWGAREDSMAGWVGENQLGKLWMLIRGSTTNYLPGVTLDEFTA